MKATHPLLRNGRIHVICLHVFRVFLAPGPYLPNACYRGLRISAAENGHPWKDFKKGSDPSLQEHGGNGFGGRWREAETEGRKSTDEATTKVQRPELKQSQ